MAVDSSGKVWTSAASGSKNSRRFTSFPSLRRPRAGEGHGPPRKRSQGSVCVWHSFTRDGLYVLDIQQDECFSSATMALSRLRQRSDTDPTGWPFPRRLDSSGEQLGRQERFAFRPATLSTRTSVQVQALPCALTYSADGRLFVANSGANTVTVIENANVSEVIRQVSIDPNATDRRPWRSLSAQIQDPLRGERGQQLRNGSRHLAPGAVGRSRIHSDRAVSDSGSGHSRWAPFARRDGKGVLWAERRGRRSSRWTGHPWRRLQQSLQIHRRSARGRLAIVDIPTQSS